MRSFQLRGTRAMLSLACLALCAAAPARADWQKVQQSGSLKVAVYNEFAPFSDKGSGIDIDIAEALAKKLGLKLSLLPFPAGENLNDDLRNMVWKGHYLGYGPADVMLHVPVDKKLMADNDKVEIFAPSYVETVRLARSAQAAGVMLAPLSRYAVQSDRRGWLFGYAGYGDEDIRAAARVVGALARRASKA